MGWCWKSGGCGVAAGDGGGGVGGGWIEMAVLWKCWFDSFGGIVVRELSCSWLVCPWVAPSVS